MKKIRILHLINSMDPGGAENLLASQLHYFDYNKIDVYVGNLYGSNTLIKNNQEKYKIIDFSNNSRFSYFLFFKLIFFLIKYKIDVIHTHLIQASIIGRFMSFFLPGLKCITTRHYAIESKQNRFINKIENYTLKYSDSIICISNYVKQYILNNFIINENKLVTIYNGVDISFFDKIPENSNKLLIGTIGRLSEQKGIDILLQSFKELLKDFPNLELEIIGNGELKNELVKLSHELKINQRVTFLGKISPTEVKKYLNDWKIFVLTSRWEAFGIVLIEAMAMQKAIVATDAEAIPEIIKDGETGYICPIDDYNGIADKIGWLLKHKKQRIEFGEKGRKRVKSQFNIEIITKKIEDLYKNMMEK